MYDPDLTRHPNLAFLWPAFAYASVSEFAANAAKQFAGLAVGPDELLGREPQWATKNTVALELKTARLRNFSLDGESGAPAIICAPLSSHSATIADIAPGHSLVETLRKARVVRLFVAEWRSATTELRLHGIDDYLADLNVLVDEIGAPVDLIGLCQGGWMSLVYAARFPDKVRKLVLAGAPVDLTAAPSALSTLAQASPLPLFHGLLHLGNGLVPGRKVMKFWGMEKVASKDIQDVLQADAPIGSEALAALEAAFRDWYSWTLDLPATYFLEVVETLYKRNALKAGTFAALGKSVDLGAVKSPMFLLAGRDDELVSPPQLFAAAGLVATPKKNIRKEVVPCSHLSLFMGERVLKDTWPRIANWIIDEQLPAFADRSDADRRRLAHKDIAARGIP